MSDGTESVIPENTDATVSRKGDVGVLDRLFRRREAGVLFGFVVLVALVAITQPDVFFDWNRMSGITARLLRQIAPYLIIGIGMTYLIIGGEFDLSVGSMYAVGGISFAILLTDYRLKVLVAVVAVLLIGVIVGLTNGIIVTKIGVPSLITTIGMLSVLRGVAFYLTPGGSVQMPSLGSLEVFGGSFVIAGLEISHQVFWSVGLLLVFGFLLQKTSFGYHVYATGDDADAAEMTGINTDRVKIANFVLTATLAAFAGVVAVSYFGSMFGTAGSGFELLIIAAVVIGGTNLFGGEGTLSGMFLGSLVIGIIPVLLVLNGLAVEIQELLTGVVIILAVVLDILFRQ
jgi:ribose/xylose/arabinose/galactoside ABC-type transport system permease subunit